MVLSGRPSISLAQGPGHRWRSCSWRREDADDAHQQARVYFHTCTSTECRARRFRV